MRPAAEQKPALRLPNVELTAEEVRKCLEWVRYCRTLDALASALTLFEREVKKEAISLAELYDYLFNFDVPDRVEDTEQMTRLIPRLAVRDNQDVARHALNEAIESLYKTDEMLGELKFTVVRGMPARVIGVTREGIAELASRLDTMRSIMCP
jgi:hypothetical protein